MAALEFTCNDQGYQKWLKYNEGGFVLNTHRIPSPGYMVLHKATCFKIGQYNKMARPGGFTERKYIKICAMTVADLKTWMSLNGNPSGKFSKYCSVCNPHL